MLTCVARFPPWPGLSKQVNKVCSFDHCIICFILFFFLNFFSGSNLPRKCSHIANVKACHIPLQERAVYVCSVPCCIPIWMVSTKWIRDLFVCICYLVRPQFALTCYTKHINVKSNLSIIIIAEFKYTTTLFCWERCHIFIWKFTISLI